MSEDIPDLLKWIREIPKIELDNGKKFIEMTMYQGTPMWWFMYYDLYRYRIPEIIKFIESANITNEKYPPLRWIVSKYLKFLKAKIKINGYLILYRIISLAYYLMIIFAYKVISKIYPHNPEIDKFEKKIIVMENNIYWREGWVGGKKYKRCDVFFDPVITELQKKGLKGIVAIFPIGFFVSRLKILVEKRKTQKDVIHRPLESYWSLDLYKKEREAVKYFSKIWKELKKNNNFKSSLVYNNLNLYEFLKYDLEYYFTVYFGKMVLYIEAAKKINEKEKPSMVLLVDESGLMWAVIGCKLKKVPTVAIQHGVIPYEGSYVYVLDENPANIVESLYCPFPDKTAVYGQYYKDILMKTSGYPEDSVVVTGHPRYDILAEAYRIFDREKVFRELNLDYNKKLIVWMTQSHGLSKNENEKNFYAVYKATKILSGEVQLVIKLHPQEYDISIHKKVAKKVGVNPVITKDIDTYNLLYASDLMITRHSTTAIEAAILDKDVLILNLSGEPDPVSYVKDGVALGVYREDALVPAVRDVLYNKEVRKKLSEARKRFVYEHAYIQDGKASKRVADLIMQMIEESKRERNEK